jgi:hypothetical protein
MRKVYQFKGLSVEEPHANSAALMFAVQACIDAEQSMLGRGYQPIRAEPQGFLSSVHRAEFESVDTVLS